VNISCKPNDQHDTDGRIATAATMRSLLYALGLVFVSALSANATQVTEAQPACPLSEIVNDVGQRMIELVDNLQRLDATESLRHFSISSKGVLSKPEDRTYDYVVTVSLSSSGFFQLEEYRNGTIDPKQFPARIATTGLAAMALIFHPSQVSNYSLNCQGLEEWNNRPAWHIHFAQRADRPNRVRMYVLAGTGHPLPLQGSVWIDPENYQVLHLESDLMRPLPEIRLTREHMAITYGPVQFRTAGQELWLPLNAAVKWERNGRRYFREHTFSNFKLFGVESTQEIKAPPASYCFNNATPQDVAGVLTVFSLSGAPQKAASIRISIPAGKRVCKLVGPGKDIDIPPNTVASAVFKHNGAPEAIVADSSLVNETMLDVVADSEINSAKH
jgi:hypothetical protein